MKKLITVWSFLSLIWLGAFSQTAVAPSMGNGTAANPFQIASLENLYWIANNSNNWNKHYIQTADIDASSTSTWFSNGEGGFRGWMPIGRLVNFGSSSVTIFFTGSYDGKGYTISNLYINRPTYEWNNNFGGTDVGLFGLISDAAEIKNIGLLNVDITGNRLVGSLAGQCFANISNCYATGSVNSVQDRAGGLVAVFSGTIKDSFSRVNVNGTNRLGGFAGSFSNNSVAINCYSAGQVSGTGDNMVGGFTGSLGSSVVIKNCFWDTENSLQTESAGGQGLTTAEMKSYSTYENAGWSLHHFWDLDESFNNGYPYLRNAYLDAPVAIAPAAGDGSTENPYQIASLQNLLWVGQNPGVWENHFVQTADIDASHSAAFFKGMPVIGSNNTNKFMGSYDGQNHLITGIYIFRHSDIYIGLFGYLQSAAIKNINLESAWVYGKNYTGMLAGYCAMRIEVDHCTVSGVVHGDMFVGSMVGYMVNDSRIWNSSSEAVVLGNNTVGGLVGYNSGLVLNSTSRGKVIAKDSYAGGLAGMSPGSITNCYSMVAVDGTANFVGGLAGSGEIIFRSYSTGSVNGSADTGGLVASNTSNATILNSFWNTETSGQETSAGGTGKTTSEMKSPDTYTEAGWNFMQSWEMDEQANDGYPFPMQLNFEPVAETPVQGDGSPFNPYQIATLENLYWLTINPDQWNNSFIQTDNIDAYQTAGWPTGWLPIGRHINSSVNADMFTGTYDGQGFVIDHLYSARGSSSSWYNFTGFFGVVSGAAIGNLGLTNADIMGRTYTGVLVGDSKTGTIISNCFVTGTVSGGFYTAGLAAGNIGHIYNCYSAVRINSSNTGNGSGGLVGLGLADRTFASFWDTEISGFTTSTGGIAKTTGEMKDIATFSEAGWNFDFMWAIEPEVNDGYPYIQNLLGLITAIEPVNGQGTEEAPFWIENLGHLYWLSLSLDQWDKHFRQTETIDAEYTQVLIGGFSPIGNATAYFTGNYNGENLAISNLHIFRNLQDNIGLFGRIENADIQKVILIDHLIKGYASTGAIAGRTANSSVHQCSADGAIQGFSSVGGIVGYIASTDITQCFSKGSASGGMFVGGIAGSNAGTSLLANNYSLKEISGSSRLGGLIGSNTAQSSIEYCYSAGLVNGSAATIGGLAGQNLGTITSSFWDMEASGQGSSAGGTAMSSAEMNLQVTFLDNGWQFPEIWHIDESEETPDNNGYPSLAWQQLNHFVRPMVSTQQPEMITGNQFLLHGTIVNLGSPLPFQHGFVWSTQEEPTLDDNKTEEGPATDAGPFASTISGLQPNTLFYVRAYAQNDAGVMYGEQVVIETSVQELTIGGVFTVLNKVYDGNTEATFEENNLTLLGVTDGLEDVILDQVAISFAQSNFGDDIQVTIATAVLTGGDSDNYVLIMEGTPMTTASILPKELFIAGSFNVADKEYDGNTDAVITVNNLIPAGIVNDEEVTLTGVEVVFAHSNTGENIPVQIQAATLTGADIGNYNLSLEGAPNSAASITPKEIIIGGTFTTEDKVYDGNATAAIAENGLIPEGIINDDEVALSSVEVVFAHSNAGENIPVQIQAAALTGADIDNYNLSLEGAPNAAASITPKEITIGGSFTTEDKVYDGNATAAIVENGLIPEGIINDDEVTFTGVEAVFVHPNVGENIPVNIIAAALAGADIGNYNLSMEGLPSTIASITHKELLITGSFSVLDKEYDGTTNAEIEQNNLILTGVVGTETVELLPLAAFASAEAGDGILVFLTNDTSIDGEYSHNYYLSMENAPTSTANIILPSNTLWPVANNISLYPNPFKDHVRVENAGHILRIVITDMSGKVVHEVKNVSGEDFVLETDFLQPGVYIFVFESETGATTLRKMIRK